MDRIDPRAAQQAAYIDWMRRETDRNGTVAAKQGPIAICDAQVSETPPAGSVSDPAKVKIEVKG